MSRTWLLGLVALALVRSAAIGVLTPPYQVSDESWHLDYPRALADGDLPVLGETRIDPEIVRHAQEVSAAEDLPLYGMSSPAMSREAFQPPLAYLAPAAAYRLASGPEGGLLAFRAWNALLGALLAVVAFLAARAAFPSPFAGPLAGLAAVLLPSVALVSSSANNDVLAALLAVAFIGAAASLAREGGSLPQFAALGALAGLGALTKISGLLLVVPGVVAAIADPRRSWRERVDRTAVMAATAGAVALPWLVRNLAVYDDFTGTSAFDRFVTHPGSELGGPMLLLGARPSLPAAEPFWPELWRTSVGVLGWTDRPLPWWSYALAALATAAGVVAVTRWVSRRAVTADRRAAAVVLTSLLAYVAGCAWFAMTVDYQPQGRYLLAALLAAAGLLGAALGRRGFAAAATVLVALLATCVATAIGEFGLT